MNYTFPFGARAQPNVTPLLAAVIATGAGAATAGAVGPKTFQASGLTSSGTGSATIAVQGTLDGVSWDTFGTITLTLGTVSTSDSFSSDDRYVSVRGNVTAISGTGASVNLSMGN
jgi:hypothetical protein